MEYQEAIMESLWNTKNPFMEFQETSFEYQVAFMECRVAFWEYQAEYQALVEYQEAFLWNT